MNDFSAIRSAVVGEGICIVTPYNPSTRVTYADHAATGRAFLPIERQVSEAVLPMLANVHSETSATGAQTIAFREEARQIIKTACKCTDEDACIFTGNGMTGAIHALLTCLGLTVPCTLIGQLAGMVFSTRPVCFIGPWEHHSVELAFREAAVELVVIAECGDGIDLNDLRAKLARYAGRRLIGCFSAGSNVTGRLTDVQAVAKCMHDAGGTVIFDYAAAGPYVDVDMSNIDCALLSPHKFLGGHSTPGVLLAKKSLFTNEVPHAPGGGTVSFVSPTVRRYATDVEHREEGGTPNIVGSIRAGLAMKLKMDCGVADILAHEQDFAARTIAAWRATPGITVLGELDEPRLGIVSFVVEHEGKALHHNFVVALLNDLFGIQARGGNSCAAPYAHRLLNLSDADENALEVCVAAGWHGAKPGWTRISYGWYDSEDTLAFVINAVRFISLYGHCFLNDYTFDPRNGSWTNVRGKPPLMSLSSPIAPQATLPESAREGYLDAAFVLASAALASAVSMQPTPFEGLRWFWLPGEIPRAPV